MYVTTSMLEQVAHILLGIERSLRVPVKLLVDDRPNG